MPEANEKKPGFHPGIIIAIVLAVLLIPCVGGCLLCGGAQFLIRPNVKEHQEAPAPEPEAR